MKHRHIIIFGLVLFGLLLIVSISTIASIITKANTSTINIISPQNKSVVVDTVNISGISTDTNVTLKIMEDNIIIKNISRTSYDRINIVINENNTITWYYWWDTLHLIKGDYKIIVGINFTNESSIVVSVNHMPNITQIALTPILGGYRVTGSATDSDTGDYIQVVQVKVDDGGWINATDITVGSDPYWSTWGYEIGTSTLKNGEHTVYARAFDIDDQHNTSKSVSTIIQITMAVQNNLDPPTISITSNLTNKVSGIIYINGTSSDDVSVKLVHIRIDDNTWVSAIGTTTWYYFLNTTMLNDGVHNIRVRAFDGQYYSEEKLINISVENIKKSETKSPDKKIPGFDGIIVISIILTTILFRKKQPW